MTSLKPNTNKEDGFLEWLAEALVQTIIKEVDQEQHTAPHANECQEKCSKTPDLDHNT